MDWISTACGDKWNINKILKICRDRNEHLLIANVKSLTWNLHGSVHCLQSNGIIIHMMSRTLHNAATS